MTELTVRELPQFALRTKLRRRGGALVLLCAFGGIANCAVGWADSSSAALSPHQAVLTAAHSPRADKPVSKRATLPQCGATRDPFDPTASPAPPGSPTAC